MRVTPGAPDYKDLALWRVKRFSDGLRDKEGMDELTDAAIGPDVKYVLGTNDIDLVRRYLKSPITIEEYRELRYKLLELQLQKTTVSAADSAAKRFRTTFDLTPGTVQRQQSEDTRSSRDDSLIDLVA